MNLWGLLVITLGLALVAVGFVGSETKIWTALTGATGGIGSLPSGPVPGSSQHAPGHGAFA